MGAPAVGRGEIAELAQSFMTTFPDMQVVMDDVHVRADCAEYHWTLIAPTLGTAECRCKKEEIFLNISKPQFL
jgi:phage/plasmid primase-like uncharacterized protein